MPPIRPKVHLCLFSKASHLSITMSFPSPSVTAKHLPLSGCLRVLVWNTSIIIVGFALFGREPHALGNHHRLEIIELFTSTRSMLFFGSHLIIVLPELVSFRSVTRVEDDLCSWVVQASFVPSDLAVLGQHPVLVATLVVTGPKSNLFVHAGIEKTPSNVPRFHT